MHKLKTISMKFMKQHIMYRINMLMDNWLTLTKKKISKLMKLMRKIKIYLKIILNLIRKLIVE